MYYSTGYYRAVGLFWISFNMNWAGNHCLLSSMNTKMDFVTNQQDSPDFFCQLLDGWSWTGYTFKAKKKNPNPTSNKTKKPNRNKNPTHTKKPLLNYVWMLRSISRTLQPSWPSGIMDSIGCLPLEGIIQSHNGQWSLGKGKERKLVILLYLYGVLVKIY